MVMKQIEAKIIADSISPQGHRITSMLLTYPRIIHSELMTHRMFSRNSASSRAIPFEKMVKMVEENPFIPIAWQSKHIGMQGTEYLDGESEQKLLVNKWLEARDLAVQQSKLLNNSNVTKQLCNRLLEPFMWHTVLVTATEWDNFFELRCPSYDGFSKNGEKVSFRSKKDIRKHFEELKLDTDLVDNQSFKSWQSINTSQAEIHIQALAEAMWDAMNESTPKKLQVGEWHIPFGDKIEGLMYSFKDTSGNTWTLRYNRLFDGNGFAIKVATARCARLSYMTFDGEIDYEKDIKLHDSLLESHHMSPFEHCARAMSDEEYQFFIKGRVKNFDLSSIPEGDASIFGWCRNFKGFKSYRQILEEC